MATERIVDHVGRVLGGRYRLLAPIGTGASAHVFLGEDVTLRRRVAVKVLHAALASDESFLRRFRAEAQAAASLNHPNIMRVFDWGEADDGPFLVLEYLAGGSLRGVLDRGDLLTPSQALLVGIEAGRALDHAHRRGLVHRDIKPANLLFDEEGRLCIADFGLARALAEAAWTEPAGAVLGTARYASPEQAQGSSVDGKADVYALALVLVEAVTGTVPFAADTTIATLMGRIGTPLVAPQELGPLGPVVESAAAPEPADRPDAATLVRRLDNLASDMPAPRPLPLMPADRAATVVDESALSDITELGARPRLYDHEADSPQARAAAALPAAAKRRRRWWPWRVPAMLLVIAMLGGAAYAIVQAITPSHPVPTVRGLSLADARSTAARLNFGLHVSSRQPSETVALDTVISQAPARGTLKENKSLGVVLSSGPAPRAVPDLTNADEAGAKSLLGAAGLVANVVRASSETVSAGKVVDWQPRGTQPKGTSILVTLSSGPPSAPVPDVKGKSYADAANILKAAGFVAAKASVFSDTTPLDQVDSTSPPAGSSAQKGGTVTVNVSKGPDQVAVPDLRAKKIDEARSILQQAGLQVGSVFGPDHARRVIDTNPSAGTKVKRGSAVDLYVF